MKALEDLLPKKEGISPDVQKIEWCHTAMPFGYFKKKSQVEDNLGAGYFDANSMMMIVEAQLRSLTEVYSKVIVESTAIYVGSSSGEEVTQLLDRINYKVRTENENDIEDKIDITFEFDMQQRGNPYKQAYDIVGTFVKTAVERAKVKASEKAAEKAKAEAISESRRRKLTF